MGRVRWVFLAYRMPREPSTPRIAAWLGHVDCPSSPARNRSNLRGPRGTLYAVPFTIRPAAVEDADAIGAVHVRSRLAAYRGVMPDEYLDGLRAQDRADGWRWHLTALRPDQKVLVVVDRDRVVGFAIFGCERGSDTSQDVGELYAINLDPEVWDRGIGRALLRRATDEHSAANHPSAGFSHQRDGRVHLGAEFAGALVDAGLAVGIVGDRRGAHLGEQSGLLV